MGTPATSSTTPGTPTTGLRERGNDTSRSTGRSGRQNAATRRNMRREERVTVQGPVKEQQPDGMSHTGVAKGAPTTPPPPRPARRPFSVHPRVTRPTLPVVGPNAGARWAYLIDGPTHPPPPCATWNYPLPRGVTCGDPPLVARRRRGKRAGMFAAQKQPPTDRSTAVGGWPGTVGRLLWRGSLFGVRFSGRSTPSSPTSGQIHCAAPQPNPQNLNVLLRECLTHRARGAFR